MSFYRKRDELFLPYFKEEKQFVYCNNAPGILGELGFSSHNPEEWRLFLDSSKRSLKCVLLHNRNKYGVIPVGHSNALKEQQNDNKTIMDLRKYREHGWIICVNLKMVSFLLGQQRSYTKFLCFLCIWDSQVVKITEPERNGPNVTPVKLACQMSFMFRL